MSGVWWVMRCGGKERELRGEEKGRLGRRWRRKDGGSCGGELISADDLNEKHLNGHLPSSHL